MGRRPPYLDFMETGRTDLVVTYDGGKLTKIVTRGNGHIGTNITHLAPAISGIPATISEKGHLVVRGEAVISYTDFGNSSSSKAKAITPIHETSLQAHSR